MVIQWLMAVTGMVAYAVGAHGTQTSSIVLTPDEGIVCAVNQDSGSISFWNWSGDGKVCQVKVGEEPRTLAVSPDGRRVFVANQRSQTLSIVDVSAGRTVGTIALGGQPYGVVIAGDGKRAFVSQYAGDYVDGEYCAGTVAVVDLEAGKVITRIKVKPRPWAMALAADGAALYVTHYLHVGDKGIVTEIDPKAMTVRTEIPLRADDDVGGGQGGIFNALAGIALHPNGRRAVVVGMHANTRRGLTRSGKPLSPKTTVQAAIRVMDVQAGRELYAARMVSSFSGQAVAVPVAVAFIGSGEHFIDVYFASNDLKVLRYNEKGYVAERALLELPAGPTGIAVTRDGRSAFVNSRWGRTICRLSLADVREPRVVKTVRATPEPWDERRILGARTFHNTRDTRMTPNRWLTCGVCHLEGGMVSDTMVWEFTKEKTKPVLLNTKDLTLSYGTSPPFLYSGAFASVQEEEHFVRGFLGGLGFVPGKLKESEPVAGKSKEMDAVAAFVLSLRPRPNPHMDGGRPRSEIREAARRGRDVFFDKRVGCGRCHKGCYLTRSGTDEEAKLYDVGTGMKADVPSLLHLWDTAPYLHDGRAASLHEVLTKHNPDDRHGRTSHLSEQDLNDLIQFLLAPYEEAGG